MMMSVTHRGTGVGLSGGKILIRFVLALVCYCTECLFCCHCRCLIDPEHLYRAF